MDLKQALQPRGQGNAGNSFNNFGSNNSKSSANSVQSDGGNNSSCSNNRSASTNTGESNRGSPVATSQLACLVGGPSAGLLNSCSPCSNPLVSHFTGRSRPPGELDAQSSRLPKLARLTDASSAHSCNLETQILFNLNGGFNSHANSSTASHHVLSSYLSSSNHSSNHGSPTSNYAGAANTCSLFNGGSAPSKVYPYATLQEEQSRHPSPFILSAVPAPHASILSSGGRGQHANLPCLMSEPSGSIFTQEQLLEFTQQTFVFKHFAAGVAPPPSLLLPIISSVANMSRLGGGHMLFGGNAGLLGVGGLRGNVDPEPGRCRRTDGKKWRCAREVVSDQKYCEKHMHRGRHRARANKPVNSNAETLNALTSLPASSVVNATNAQASTGISMSFTHPFASPTSKEPPIHFLQSASMASAQINRSSSISGNDSNSRPPAAAGGLKRLLEINNSIGGAPSRNLAAPPDQPPNLAELLKASSSAKPASLTNLHLPARARDSLDSPFFACQQPMGKDPDNASLSQIVDSDPWPRNNRVADNPPSNLSWFEQLSEEQNKRSSFNTELSISTLKSPLTHLSTKFGSGQSDDLVGSVDASHFMGLSMDIAGTKIIGIGRAEEDRYSGRNTWVPIAWDSPSIGGPLGEVLQPNAGANSGGSFSGSLANNGGERCLNLTEDESWVHQEPARVGSPVKDSHSPSLASPSGVLQMKASFNSYSDSSSSASSPRSALKLDCSANLGIL